MNQKVKISLRFVSWLDILDIPQLQYSLHSVQTRRDQKDEAAISARTCFKSCLAANLLSPFSPFYPKSIGRLTLYQRTILLTL